MINDEGSFCRTFPCFEAELLSRAALVGQRRATGLRDHAGSTRANKWQGAPVACDALRDLEGMVDQGLIAEANRRASLDEDDARRRCYRSTALGRRVLAAESMRLENSVRVIRAKRRTARSGA